MGKDDDVDDVGHKGAGPSGRPIDAAVQAHIGARLRSMYDSFLAEPVPQHLIDLLERLDAVDPSRKPADGGDE